jgi:peptidoglycan hydrolase-like protein with peptidoglycan-binding domain
MSLNERGFDAGPTDGIFGPLTLRAVLSFQKYAKLWVDGLVGPRTQSALGMG